MVRLLISVRWLLLLLLLLAVGTTQGCNCESNLDRQDPMSIKFLAPTGTLITDGFVRAKIDDLNGIDTVTVVVNGKEVATKSVEGKSEYTIAANFELDPMPDQFTITVKATDKTGEKGEKSLDVRKDQGTPQLRFTKPLKIDDKHPKLFVGKLFTATVEARDRSGIAEIVLSLAISAKEEQPVRTCAINGTEDKWEACESELNLSDAKYKDGDYILSATAKNAGGKDADRKKVLQVTLDKTGPQLQIKTPNDGQRLKGGEEFRVIARDQVGVKKVELFVNDKALNVQQDTANPDEYFGTIDKSLLGGGDPKLKVVASDNLDNVSELLRDVRGGCQRDEDCEDATMRCCVGNSPTNKDGTLTGRCFKVQDAEGSLCDPCTQPCGKGSDGKLMGCLPGACDRPPHRCRRACNLGNPNQAADDCNPANAATGDPAEYCTRSDITKINATLGSCALGDNCDPINQQTCQAGAQPPYNNCCPSGFGCYPADKDANICIPEGSTGPKQQNCELHNCQGGRNCTKGYLCTVQVDAQGRPQGPSSCNPMCVCGSLCRSGLPSSAGCPSGAFCAPVRLTNGNVPLPVGVCITP